MAKEVDGEKQKTAFGKFDYREIAKQYKFKNPNEPKAKKVVPADFITAEEDLDYLNDMYSISVAE